MICKECPAGKKHISGSIYCIEYGIIIREDHECTLEGLKDQREISVSAVTMCAEEPKYDILAEIILKECREFYEDPENVRAFEAWKAGRGK